MPFQTVDQLARFADAVGSWKPPRGFVCCVLIGFAPGGLRRTVVTVTLDYGGLMGVVGFPSPVEPRRARRMLDSAARKMLSRHPQRN